MKGKNHDINTQGKYFRGIMELLETKHCSRNLIKSKNTWLALWLVSQDSF